jgi:hypothetical protein
MSVLPRPRHLAQPTYVVINDTFADWYRSHYQCSSFSDMWGKCLKKILDDLDIMYNVHECSIYRGTIDRKVVFTCMLSLVTIILWLKGSGSQVTSIPR